MKAKKITVKKKKRNLEDTEILGDVLTRTKKMRINKLSKPMLIFIIATSLIFLIASIFIFGVYIAIPFVLLYLLMILLVRVIDKYPVGNKKRRLAKTIFYIILIAGILGVLLFMIFFIAVIIESPEFDVKNLERNETTLIYDNKNNIISKLGNEKREKLEYDELPNVLVDAIVATEDSRFFQHNGVDAPRFLKAVIGQLAGRSDAGGGSTLTMQVAKNNFTSREASGIKGIIRKFTDIYLAVFKIERAFSKEEIMEYYVNEPFLGSSSYGVEQAAQTYFGKHAKELNLAEASIIAGLFQAPGAYDPFENPEAAEERRSTVLSLMVRHGYITKEEKEIAESISVKSLLVTTKTSANEYQGYVDLVIEEIVNKTGMDPYAVPMEVYTNMDAKKQTALDKVFSGNDSYYWPYETIQGAAIAVESKTGKIIAVGAGRNRKGERTFNYATDIERQIGSTAKPLFDYGPAIEYNNWSTGHILNDHRISYPGGGGYIVNYDGAYRGNITIRYALSDSRNVPAVLAFQSVDNEKIKKFVTTLGIKPEIDSTGYIHQAHALGAFNGASPIQMAGAYAAFSNGGTYREPYSVNKIILRSSDEKIEFSPEPVKAMSDATAYMITDILKAVPGLNGVTGFTTDQFAMKTGTTNYDVSTARQLGYSTDAAPDGWIVGYTPDITMAMWTGYIDNKPGVYLSMSQMYSHRNALYRACGRAVYDNNGATFTKPSSVVAVKIVKGTENLPSSATPSSMIVTELFKRGYEPKTVTTKYDTLSNPGNLTLDYSSGKVKLSWSGVSKPKDADESFGDLGYNVYLNGKLLGFTTSTSYTYSGSSPYGTYTVKATYKNNNSAESSGVSKSLQQDIDIISNVDSTGACSPGETFTVDPNPYKVTENGIDVTSQANITVTVDGNALSGNTFTCSTTEGDTHTISYKVSYDGKSDSDSTTVTVTPANP